MLASREVAYSKSSNDSELKTAGIHHLIYNQFLQRNIDNKETPIVKSIWAFVYQRHFERYQKLTPKTLLVEQWRWQEVATTIVLLLEILAERGCARDLRGFQLHNRYTFKVTKVIHHLCSHRSSIQTALECSHNIHHLFQIPTHPVYK